MSGVSRYAYGITEKPVIRQKRHCKLCGEVFYSNKALYCSYEHSKEMECFNNGRMPSIRRIVFVLLERKEYGASLEERQAYKLLEWGWIEKIEGTKDSFRLSKWGLEAIDKFINT